MRYSTIIFGVLICIIGSSFLNPESIKTNAVIISDKTIFTIESKEESSIERSYSAIINNKYARGLRQVVIYYDDFRKVKDAEVKILSLAGNEIKKYKLKDFEDYGIGMGNTASDSRVKHFESNYSRYPYIIQVSYEVEKSGSLHYPIWTPQEEENIEVKSSEFDVIDYSGNQIQYKAHNLADPEIKEDGKRKVYHWEIENVSPFEYEKYNGNLEDYAPVLHTSPKTFEMEGIIGSMNSWKDFGKWIQQLNQGKNDLEETDLKELDLLVQNATSEREKIRIVYEFLQKNTRYVSIQLGIGGWQPFNASYVHQNKYGDCKALSMYTKTLLEHYGIESFYTLIKAGANTTAVEQDFPNGHFNHAIVTVPVESDTLFLECTSQTSPFGYSGTFTSNRNALMITPEGGKLVKTKKYSPEENVQRTSVHVDLSNKDAAKVNISRTFEGLEIDNHNFHSLYWKEQTEIAKWFVDNYTWGNEKMENYELLDRVSDEIPVEGFHVQLQSQSESVNMGDRMFIKPNRYTNHFLRNLKSDERKTPINIRYGYTQMDTIVYELSKFYMLEANLEPLNIETKYGNYSRKLVQEGNQLKYIRKFQLKDGVYPVEEYPQFKEFVNEVVKADRDIFVLLDKT
jgi:hypothetical protein